MGNKIFSAAIIGCGNRGAESYGALFHASKDKFKIVALCDVNDVKLKKYGERFSVPKEARFLSEDEFFAQKRADFIVIGTMDADHVRQCVKALSLGYDVLLEKPITTQREECYRLLEAQKKYGGKVLVCHVLRYAPAFVKTYELLQQGAIGELVAIQALEQVIYWHEAHSYVRGNWRRTEDTAPMILAKCCHDLDLLQWYARSKCECISSVGALTYFKEENAPAGAALRCTDCSMIESCPYSAKRIYVDTWKRDGCLATVWPHNQITTAYPLSEEALYTALREGPYGRCVYHCDNDAVDHQLTQMTFENGVKATLTMTAFTAKGGRIYKFFGTLGELVLNEEEDVIQVKPFGEPVINLPITPMVEGGHGHGGGDNMLVRDLYRVLTGELNNETSLEASVESHLMGICAEESRLQGGACIKVHGGK